MNKRSLVASLVLVMAVGAVAFSFVAANRKATVVQHQIKDTVASSQSSFDKQAAEPISDEAAATLVTQAQESRENFRRLAEGQISELEIDGAATGDESEQSLKVKVKYSDGSSLNGTIDFVNSNGMWILAKATNDSNPPIGESLPVLSDDETQMGRGIVKKQGKKEDQEYIAEMMTGKITAIRMINVEPSEGRVKINAECQYADGTVAQAIIDMEELNGYWYMTGADKK